MLSTLLRSSFLLILGTASTAALFAAPLPCQTASLQTYIASGPCALGNTIVSDFTVLPNPSAGPAIGSENITITPSVNNFTQTLEFRFNNSAAGSPFGSTFEQVFTYLVTPLGTFTNAAISLLDTNVTGDGVIVGSQFLCQGGPLSADGSSCNAAGSFFGQSALSIFPSDTSLLSSSLPLDFNLNPLFVRNEIVVDGGLEGLAAGGAYTNSFTAVPEPAGLSFFASLLFGAGLYYRRKKSS